MQEITIKIFTFNDFQENTYVLSHSNKEAIIIDPGCNSTMENLELFNYIEDNQLHVTLILNTHCHIDHVLGNAAVVEKYQKPLWAPAGEKIVLQSLASVANMYGIPFVPSPEPNKWIDTSDEIKLGPYVFEIISAPGHSPDSLVFYIPAENIAIGGDVLFRDSIGRTDLPGGNHDALLSNIKNKLYKLPKDTVIYPGHGPSTTIGYEKKHNPFVRG